MLITEYFQRIESQIADCIHIVESRLLKDKRSLHIGIIECELLFTDWLENAKKAYKRPTVEIAFFQV